MIRFAFRLIALVLTAAPAALLMEVPASAAPKVINTTGAPLVVDVGKGQLIQLERSAAAVFVADPDVADVQVKSPTLVYVFGKSGGETTLYAVGENDQVVLNVAVRVRHDVARVEEAIHKMVPRSAVSVVSIDDSLVLEGTVYSAAEGDDVRRVVERFVPDPKQLVNRMKVDAPNQVQLRVKVAEISRNVVKQFGINWESMFGSGNFLIGLATGRNVLNFLPNPSGANNLGAFATRGIGVGSATADQVNNLSLGFNAGSANFDALIDALDKQGLVSVLAQPNLSAISGEPASFLAGGEFPVPVPQSTTTGVPTIGIIFKKFGVSLEFVATIGANNRINMHVQPEVSQLSNQGSITIVGAQVPSLVVRRAETTIDLASGQSFAIAGLLQNNVNQTITKFPWLGDVPVLGALFRSDAFQRNETELVIIVTPYIVRPVAVANRLQSPTDGYVTSSDADLLVRGTEYKQQPVATPAGRSSGLVGPVGFELE
jgi:pilus assembly protein CpaC